MQLCPSNLRRAAVAVAVLAFTPALASADFVGVASGTFTATADTPIDDLDASLVTVATDTSAVSTAGGFAQSDIGLNRVLANSTTTPVNQRQLTYSGSLWADVLTFDRVASVEDPIQVVLTWGLTYDVSDDLGQPLPQRQAAFRSRTFAGAAPDPSFDPALHFLREATFYDGTGDFRSENFVVPPLAVYDVEINDLPPGGVGDNFAFNFPEQDELGEFIDSNPYRGPLTTFNADGFSDLRQSLSLTLISGDTLAIGQALDAWALGGAIVDSSESGVFGTIGLPAGVGVTSAAGFDYTLVTIPEPASAALLLLPAAAALRRRR